MFVVRFDVIISLLNAASVEIQIFKTFATIKNCKSFKHLFKNVCATKWRENCRAYSHGPVPTCTRHSQPDLVM